MITTTKIKFVSGKSKPILRDSSKNKAPRIDQSVIAKAFDSQAMSSFEGFDLFAVRESMTQLLRSSGGRPSLEGAESQVKIPRIETDWTVIDALAHATADMPHKASPTQVAAILLHLAISRISKRDIEEALRKEYA
jgi:hypothetical protein